MGKKELGSNHIDPGNDQTSRRQLAEQWRFSIPLDRPIPHDQCETILNGPLRDAVNLFVKRQTEYAENAYHLGAKGQFSEINRKFWKLKRLMWDENVPADVISESAEEVLMDFIGHALLSIHFLRENQPAPPDVDLSVTVNGTCACGILGQAWTANPGMHGSPIPGPHHNRKCHKWSPE